MVNTITPNSFGDRLRHAREWRNLSIEESATRAGMTPEAWRSLERLRGSKYPPPDDVIAAGRALGVLIQWLLTGDSDPGEIPV